MPLRSTKSRSARYNKKDSFTGQKKAIVLALLGLTAVNVSAADWVLSYDPNVARIGYANHYLAEGEIINLGDSVTVNSINQDVVWKGNSGALHAGEINITGKHHQLNVRGGSFTSENESNWALYGATRLTEGGITAHSDTTGVTISNVTGHFDIYGAGRVSANSSYHVGKSVVKVTDSVINGRHPGASGQIYGGGYIDKAGAKLVVDGTYVIVDNVTGKDDIKGKGSRVYGGGYIRSAGVGALLQTKETLVEVSGDKTELFGVYGGGHTSGANETSLANLSAVNTKVVIRGGKIGEVVGGHHVNFYGKAEVTGKSEVVILGGDIGNVIGGNLLDFDEEGNYEGENPRTAVTKEASVIIQGGKVENVYGGSYADKPLGVGVKLNSNVTDVASITINNAEITGNVYGGGFAKGEGTVVEVKNAQISISNATVKGDTITTEGFVAADTSGKTGESKATSAANMKLTNVTAPKATVESKVGTVELRAEGAQTTSIANLSVAPSVKVALTADGASNDASKGNIKNAIQIKDGKYVAGSVAMDEGMQQGAVHGNVTADGQVNVIQQTNSIMGNTLDLYSASTLSLNRIMMSDLRKRMGDLRSVEGSNGVWARYNGGKFAGDQNLENEFSTVEFGLDTIPTAEAPRFGVAMSYTKSDAEMNRGSADMDALSVAFYGTKMYDNGLYVDMIGRMGTSKTDITVDGNKKGSVDNVAMSLSGELGWRFDVTDMFYVEPQTELTYTYINDDTLTLSEGSSYKFDSVSSLIGRAGFATGFKCPADKGDVYVRVSAVHEFAGDSAVRTVSTVHEVDGKDTWVEFGLGANFIVGKNAYLYADVERTEGAKLDEEWRANVGVRFAF